MTAKWSCVIQGVMNSVPLLACKQCGLGFLGKGTESTASAKQWHTARSPEWRNVIWPSVLASPGNR